MSTINYTFGRELSLNSKTQLEAIYKYIDDYVASLQVNSHASLNSHYNERFKGMSWAEVSYQEEEEEEEKQKEKEREELSKILDERKFLFKRRLYELEEGEILDL